MKKDLTQKLKAALWQRYGNPAYPAEWDGTIYGGGKISQRFWEYFIAIDLLELAPDSVVLDIGGGSPVTGAGFFTQVIAPYVKQVHVMDLNIAQSQKPADNIIFHRVLGSYEALSKLLQENPEITHIASISVFEHIPHEVRCGMMKAINDFFLGDIFVNTVEYHPRDCYFEQQLTVQTLSELHAPFTKFYLDVIRKSPVLTEVAYRNPSMAIRLLNRLGIHLKKKIARDIGVPLWFPLALRYRRMGE